MTKKAMWTIISIMIILMGFIIVATVANISGWIIITVSAILAVTMIITALILTKRTLKRKSGSSTVHCGGEK